MEMVRQKTKMTPGRIMILWLASFAVVASFLYFHFGVPLLPIVLAGGATLVITTVRCFFVGRTRSSGESEH